MKIPMATSRPNILLLLTDQQRFDTIAALGNPVIKTPNLDRLVREGAVFERAYTPSPECVPARCSLHYGQYPLNTNCYSNGYSMPEDGRKSYVDALTEAGYRTHGVGKTHFSPKYQDMRGYQTRDMQEEVMSKGGDDYVKYIEDVGYGHVFEPHGARGEMYYMPQPSALPVKHHPTNWVADRAIDFIESQEAEDDPWYLTASFIHPHPPFAPPSPWHKLYRAIDMPLPKVPEDYESLQILVNKRQNRTKYRDQGYDNNHIRCMIAYYYACISFIDYQVGRILDTLEKQGQLDNTLIVYTSDHGELLGDYRSYGKRSPHDSAMRIPMLCRHPETFKEGTRSQLPVSLIDLAPTFLRAGQADESALDLDGIALQDASSGQTDREEMFSQLGHADRATYSITTQDWKYVYSVGDRKELLFDLKHDPGETRNKANTPFIRDVQGELKSRLIAFLKDGGEEAAVEGNDWKQYPIAEVPDNPDSGVIAQDSQGFDWTIPGYKEQNDDKGNTIS